MNFEKYVRNKVFKISFKIPTFSHPNPAKKLEIHEQRVAVCRDHVNGICRRQQCKYYHIPIQLPSAHEMAMSGGGK